MSQPRVSEGLGRSQGQGSTGGQEKPSGPYGSGATYGGLYGIVSAAGPSQPSYELMSEKDMDSATAIARGQAQGARMECCTDRGPRERVH